MTDRTKVTPATDETRREYLQEEAEYFGNLQKSQKEIQDAQLDKKPSASDAAHIEKALPSPQAQYEMAQRLALGFDKTSRSGAFSKAGAGPAIFPSGLKFASNFIDEMSPKGWKPPAARPVPTQQDKRVDIQPAAAILTHICIDCMKPTDENNAKELVTSMFFMAFNDPVKLFSMGLKADDIVLCVEHKKCHVEAQKKQKDSAPLVLVADGHVASAEDIRIAEKYGFPISPHDGREITMGQFYLHKRKDRLEQQLTDYLCQLDKTSEIYRKNKKEQTVA